MLSVEDGIMISFGVLDLNKLFSLSWLRFSWKNIYCIWPLVKTGFDLTVNATSILYTIRPKAKKFTKISLSNFAITNSWSEVYTPSNAVQIQHGQCFSRSSWNTSCSVQDRFRTKTICLLNSHCNCIFPVSVYTKMR